jgi:carbon storage regulator
MLVLSRRLGESIVMDGDIKVTITGITKTSVRIGIEAPEHIAILREELCENRGDPSGQVDQKNKTGCSRENEL